MEYCKLGNTNIQVSKICLGTMTFGEQNTEDEAHLQLDYAIERGINFIDTAEMYPVPPTAQTYSKTESIIGKWKKIKTQRDKLVIATKAASSGRTLNYIRDGLPKLDKKNIIQALEASLKRLNTDYIDLYQLHWPDRNSNYFGKLGYVHDPSEDFTPIEETLEALSEVSSSGKVKYFGLSNETPWGVMKFLHIAEKYSYPRIVSVQNPYNLLNRIYEIGLSEITHRENVSLLAYSPLGFGTLTGKYLNGNYPQNCRLTLYRRFQRYNNTKSKLAIQRYSELAKDSGISPTQMALSFVYHSPFVTSTIIGATNLQQLEEDIDSIHIKLKDDLLEKIEFIHIDIPNPAP